MARQSLRLTIAEWERIERISADMIAAIERQQQEINAQLQEQAGQLQELTEALVPLGMMRMDSLLEQAPSLIMKAAAVLNVTFQHGTQDEFDAFMLDDSVMSGFPCTQCGVCCKSLRGVEEYKELDRGDGVCLYLDEDSLRCGIYEKRPLKCRVDDMYEAYCGERMTLQEFYHLNAKACNLMQETYGVERKYRVTL